MFIQHTFLDQRATRPPGPSSKLAWSKPNLDTVAILTSCGLAGALPTLPRDLVCEIEFLTGVVNLSHISEVQHLQAWCRHQCALVMSERSVAASADRE